MHIRTFKAQAAKKFCKANPGWTVGETFLPANRTTNASREESLTWGVQAVKGAERRPIWLSWSPSNGFWMSGGQAVGR